MLSIQIHYSNVFWFAEYSCPLKSFSRSKSENDPYCSKVNRQFVGNNNPPSQLHQNGPQTRWQTTPVHCICLLICLSVTVLSDYFSQLAPRVHPHWKRPLFHSTTASVRDTEGEGKTETSESPAPERPDSDWCNQSKYTLKSSRSTGNHVLRRLKERNVQKFDKQKRRLPGATPQNRRLSCWATQWIRFDPVQSVSTEFWSHLR